MKSDPTGRQTPPAPALQAEIQQRQDTRKDLIRRDLPFDEQRAVRDVDALLELLRSSAAPPRAQTPEICATCVHLTAFELTEEILTCPVVNIRIHRESAGVFGCNQHEAKG